MKSLTLSDFTSKPVLNINNYFVNKLGKHKDTTLVSLVFYIFITTLISQIFLIPIEIFLFKEFTGITFFFSFLFGFFTLIGILVIFFENKNKRQ